MNYHISSVSTIPSLQVPQILEFFNAQQLKPNLIPPTFSPSFTGSGTLSDVEERQQVRPQRIRHAPPRRGKGRRAALLVKFFDWEKWGYSKNWLL